MFYGERNGQLVFVQSIQATGAAYQDIRGIALFHEFGAFEDAAPVKISGKNDDEVSARG